MSRPTDEELLLRQIPESGEFVGNYQLTGELGWEDEKYFRVRNSLIEKGIVEVGRGRGGSVGRQSSSGAVRRQFAWVVVRWADELQLGRLAGCACANEF